MKKPLFISLTALAVLGITTATTLYAQTTTGSSMIARMKAAAAAFTLSADLNPGQTGFESAPVSGKKTGNILTAAEWNRMLELVAQGGGGAGGAGWENVPLTDTTDFDESCIYRARTLSQWYYMNIVQSNRIYWYSTGSWNIYINKGAKSVFVDDSPNADLPVAKIEKLCGGGSASTGTTTPVAAAASNLTYINPDNTDFAPLDCVAGMNYMINPIAFSAESASSFTTRKMATLGAGNWQVKGTGFVRIRNKNSNVAQTLRVSSVLDSTTTNLLDSAPDLGMYANSFLASVSVPAGKTTELRVSVKNNTLHGGNILAWCTN